MGGDEGVEEGFFKITIKSIFWYGQQQNHKIYKQTSVLVLVFPMLLFWFY
jgi:hypothetical protein